MAHIAKSRFGLGSRKAATIAGEKLRGVGSRFSLRPFRAAAAPQPLQPPPPSQVTAFSSTQCFRLASSRASRERERAGAGSQWRVFGLITVAGGHGDLGGRGGGGSSRKETCDKCKRYGNQNTRLNNACGASTDCIKISKNIICPKFILKTGSFLVGEFEKIEENSKPPWFDKTSL